MIKFKYLPGWHTQLNSPSIISDEYNSTTLTLLHTLLKSQAFPCHDIQAFAQMLFQYVMDQFHQDLALKGLLHLVKYTNKTRISPFSACECYCIKIESISLLGHCNFNISPIYYLGPEYLDAHALRTGKALDQSAIIGLARSSNNLNEPASFQLGIDAGIAFEGARIPHNKTMQLNLQHSNEGVIADLICENHTTTKVLPWDGFGIHTTESMQRFEPLSKIA